MCPGYDRPHESRQSRHAAGHVDGAPTVLRPGRRKEVLARIEMGSSLYSRPAVVGDALYLATARRLYLIAAKP